MFDPRDGRMVISSDGFENFERVLFSSAADGDIETFHVIFAALISTAMWDEEAIELIRAVMFQTLTRGARSVIDDAERQAAELIVQEAESFLQG
jgi:predicted RNA methylase